MSFLIKSVIIAAGLFASTVVIAADIKCGAGERMLAEIPKLPNQPVSCFSDNIQMEGAGVKKCPAGFVLVKANAKLHTSDFCMSQYTISGTGASTNVADSCAGAAPAREQLFAEWLAAAIEIAQTDANWSGGSVGLGMLVSRPVAMTFDRPGSEESFTHLGQIVKQNPAKTWFYSHPFAKETALVLSNGQAIYDMVSPEGMRFKDEGMAITGILDFELMRQLRPMLNSDYLLPTRDPLNLLGLGRLAQYGDQFDGTLRDLLARTDFGKNIKLIAEDSNKTSIFPVSALGITKSDFGSGGLFSIGDEVAYKNKLDYFPNTRRRCVVAPDIHVSPLNVEIVKPIQPDKAEANRQYFVIEKGLFLSRLGYPGILHQIYGMTPLLLNKIDRGFYADSQYLARFQSSPMECPIAYTFVRSSENGASLISCVSKQIWNQGFAEARYERFGTKIDGFWSIDDLQSLDKVLHDQIDPDSDWNKKTPPAGNIWEVCSFYLRYVPQFHSDLTNSFVEKSVYDATPAASRFSFRTYLTKDPKDFILCGDIKKPLEGRMIYTPYAQPPEITVVEKQDPGVKH